jgi:glutathione synthase
MPLTVAVQMDPIERIRIAGDSTFALLLEAQARGHRILHYTPERLRLNGTRVEVMAEPLTVKDVEGDHARLGEAKPISRRRIFSSASTRKRWSSTTHGACAIRPKSCS